MNKKIEERLNLTEQQIRDFCQQNHIQELSLFGSVLRDDFNNNSDLDFLVVFKPEFQISLIELVDLQYQLEDLTGRKVDLIDKRSILDSYNWLRRQNILNTARVIYELRLVHDYDEVKLDLVWQVVINYIPELLNYITPLLPPKSDLLEDEEDESSLE